MSVDRARRKGSTCFSPRGGALQHLGSRPHYTTPCSTIPSRPRRDPHLYLIKLHILHVSQFPSPSLTCPRSAPLVTSVECAINLARRPVTRLIPPQMCAPCLNRQVIIRTRGDERLANGRETGGVLEGGVLINNNNHDAGSTTQGRADCGDSWVALGA